MLSEDDIVAYAPDPDSVRQTVRSAMRDVMSEQISSSDDSRAPLNESIRSAMNDAGEANGAAGISGVADVLRRLASTAEAQLAVNEEMRSALSRQAQDMSELNESIANSILERSLKNDGEGSSTDEDDGSPDGSSRPVKSSRDLQEEMLEIQRQQLEIAKSEKTERDRREKDRKSNSSSDGSDPNRPRQETQTHRITQSAKEERQILSNLGLSGLSRQVGGLQQAYGRISTAFNTLNSLRIGLTTSEEEVPSRLVLRAAAMGIDPRELKARESDNARETVQEHEEAVQRVRGNPSSAEAQNDPALNRGGVSSRAPREGDTGSLGAPAGNVADRSDEVNRVQEAVANQIDAERHETTPASTDGAQSQSGQNASNDAARSPSTQNQSSKNSNDASRNSSLGSQLAGSMFDDAVNAGMKRLGNTAAGQAVKGAVSSAGEKIAGTAAGKAVTGAVAKAGASKLGGAALSKLAGAAGGPVGAVVMGVDTAMGAVRAGREAWWDQVDKGSLQGGGGMEGMGFSLENLGQDALHWFGLSRSTGKDLDQYRQTASAANMRIGSSEANNLIDTQKWAKENGVDTNTAARLTQTMITFGASADDAKEALQGMKDSAHEAGIDLKQYAKNVGGVSGMLNSGGGDVTNSIDASEEVLASLKNMGGKERFGTNQVTAENVASIMTSDTAKYVATNMGISAQVASSPETLLAYLQHSDRLDEFVDRAMSWSTNMAQSLGGSDEWSQMAVYSQLTGISGLPKSQNLRGEYEKSVEKYSDRTANSSSYDEGTNKAANDAVSKESGSKPVDMATVMNQGLAGMAGTDKPFMGQVSVTVQTENGLNAKVTQGANQNAANYGMKSQTEVLNGAGTQQ